MTIELRQITERELARALRKHKLWLANKNGGERIDLSYANLDNSDLHDVNLAYANLYGASLVEANLDGACLKKATLDAANLTRAKLNRVDLCGAFCAGTILHDAVLAHAELRGAVLYKAELHGANLEQADLHGASLNRADLRGANMDFSSGIQFSCRGLHIKIDACIAAQIAYHFCAQDCDDPDYITARNAILDFANKFHRVHECGALKPITGKTAHSTSIDG